MKSPYPANKTHFKKLVPFAQKIIKTCKDNGINPIIYGSFAHFFLTKDEEMKVNDIDLLVPEKDLPRIERLLGKSKFKVRYVPEWNTMTVKEGKLRVEIDAIGFWYKDLKNSPIFMDSEKVNFYGVKTKLMSLKNLERLYLIAYERTNDNKKKIKVKIMHLENFLGRKLR